MSTEETKLVEYFQKEFLKAYLCKPPLELLEVLIAYHRIVKQYQSMINNIQIQLSNPNSDLNIQLQNQIIILNNRMMQ